MKNRQTTALRAALIYAVAGSLWILFTDGLLDQFTADRGAVTYLSLLKGFIFVIVSALIVYILVNSALSKLMKAEQELLDANQKMKKSRDEIASSYEQLLVLRKKLHDLAYYDQLTGLRNHTSLMEEMESIGTRKEKFAFIFIDVDNFKYVNDAFGHNIGDQILKELSIRLAGLVDENCELYRLAGDKFIILLNGIDGIFDIEKFTLKVLKSFKEAVVVDNKPFYHTASIGVSIYPDHGSTVGELIKCAEIAVYKAKDTGKNRIVIYNEPMVSSVYEWVDTEKYLRSALEKNEFELYFQPQYDVKACVISGFEALIRWRNDEKGFIMPSKFLKVAEDTHMIIPIGEWVLRNACIFVKRLQQEGFADITVSVNISHMQLLQDNFVESVMEDVELAGIKPENLEIEVAESIIIEYYDTAADKLDSLRRNGIKVALDNFGKGYSALNYLRRLPISSVKIDRSYADIVSFGEDSRMLAEFMLKTGKSAGLCVVCEGVETQEQFDYMKMHGCDKVQGYYISRPLPEKDAIEKLRQSLRQSREN